MTNGRRTSRHSVEVEREGCVTAVTLGGSTREEVEEGSPRLVTWLLEQVTLHHLTHAADLLTHQLRVGDALDELSQKNA